MIGQFYRLAQLPPWDGPVNENVAQVFGAMLTETRRCSDAFAWVRKPPTGRASIAWLALQLGRGIFNSHSAKLSFLCARTVALKWKTQMEMAAYDVALKRVPSHA